VNIDLLIHVPLNVSGVKVHYVPRLPTKPLRWVTSNYEERLLIPRLVRKSQILHTNIAARADFALRAKKTLGKPVVHTAHGVPMPEIETEKNSALQAKVEEEKLRNLKDNGIPIISISNFCKKMLAERLGISSEVVYHGVDFRLFNPNVGKEGLSRKFIRENEKLVLSVTRMHPSKEPFTLIRAIPEVVKKFPSVNFVIIGSGPLLPQVINLSKKLGVFDKLTLIEHVPFSDLHEYYGASDVFVHTGVMEFFGLALLEAMACKKAVITPDAGATPEIAGDAGLRFRHGDSTDLAGKIVLLLSDDDLRQNRALKAFRRSREFTWKNAAAKYMELYKSLL